MSVIVRSMEERDLPTVLEVLRRALGEPPGLERTEELWRWKHIDNPFGRSLVLLAEVGERVAGVRAFMRWELVTPEGTLIRCVRAVDTATDPDFHRRGIFRTLTEAAVEKAESEGVDLIFNTPNPSSGAGYLQMGWSEVGPIGIVARPSLRLLTPPVAEDATLVDAPAGAPSDPVPDRAPRGLRTPRTSEYLTWRYGRHPGARYRTVSHGDSATVVRENRRRGRAEVVVSDLLGPSPLGSLRRAARLSRAAYMVGSFPPGSPERRVAVAAGMIPVPRVRALTLFARPLGEIPGVLSLASWDVTFGDLELL